MKFEEQVDLAQYSTMRLGGKAKYLCVAESKADIAAAVQFAAEKNVPHKIIGYGSNVVWSGNYEGLVIINRLLGISINTTTVTVQAGEVWDEVVATTVKEGLSGFEYLSLIPGTAGATPIQNVGAYGSEIQDTLTSLEAFDTTINEFVTLSNTECNFGYRSSRFNTHDSGRFIITSITCELSTKVPEPPFYQSLEHYFADHNIAEYSSQIVRDAVIAIRQSKLPDPAVLPNTGSFFSNPIITKEQFAELQNKYADMPHWSVDDGVKIPAGWLLETAGFKGYTDEATGMGIYEKHALVMVNHNASTANDLLQFKQMLISTVQEKFGITLKQEPELV